MSKKDYNLVASVLLENSSIHDQNYFSLVEDFVDKFQSENPNFNASKFREACGLV